ncbi:MAG: methylmalonyl Co-A mutase-associated GTPase MeaB [Tetrasphaera sp.]|nr:methylmalonyl Co-A mutase-associated GTPase MeaB [Tetrasphaera sp.]HRC17568.1 methylmalonyl Co-A mutase-associated GTPase MeaB [Phycicoccus elongatus]
MSRSASRVIDVPALVEQIRAGRPRGVARGISLIEQGHHTARDVLAGLTERNGHAHVVGLTGAPGVGKSTTTNAIVRELRSRGRVVGVLAVDPSSPFSGGALLGDRIRMEEHATDAGVFLRSMASRGHLGGVAAATTQAVRVMEAAGCDVVLIETVGVGQSEVEVVALADTTVVLLAPGLGDGIQAAKAGILEIGDVFVVNKADRDGADNTVRDLRHMIQMSDRSEPGRWRPPVLKATALSSDGLEAVVDAVADHRIWLERTGALAERRRDRTRAEVLALALAAMADELEHDHARLDAAVSSVVEGSADASSAAADLVERFRRAREGSPGLAPQADPRR